MCCFQDHLVLAPRTSATTSWQREADALQGRAGKAIGGLPITTALEGKLSCPGKKGLADLIVRKRVRAPRLGTQITSAREHKVFNSF
jgi:hypothetical protein